MELEWRVRAGRECLHCGEWRRVAMRGCVRSKYGHRRTCTRCEARRAREWYAANSERGRATSAARRKSHPEYAKEWRASNRAKWSGYSQKRNALRAGATIETFEDVEIFERDGYICYLGGCKTDPTLPRGSALRTVLEHRIPLTRGGEHSRANCATACWRHNSQKHAMTDSEWFARLESAA